MAKQTLNGKAFEYACLKVMQDKLVLLRLVKYKKDRHFSQIEISGCLSF